MLDGTYVMFFTPVNVQFFRLCLSSYKCALWLHCRHRRDVSSGCEQRCPNWQRRRLRLALQLLAATTTSAQNAANGHKRQVRDMIWQFAVLIWVLILLWECYSDREWIWVLILLCCVCCLCCCLFLFSLFDVGLAVVENEISANWFPILFMG